jgi:preprotein translocase subunit SecD/SecD/SecF fusion protein
LDKKQQAILALVAITALVLGALWLIIPPEKIPRGLDIRGGLSVILTARPETGTALRPEQIEQADLIIKNRVNRLGIAESSVQRQGSNALLVQIPGIKDPQQALATIGRTGQLEFREVLTGPNATRTAGAVTLKDRDGASLVVGPALIKGDALTNANIGVDAQTNSPEVNMEFNEAGAKTFGELTQRLVNKQFAIVLDKVIQSAPVVQEAILDGKARITGKFTFDEAKQLAIVLQTGSLPVALDISDSRVVGPTLGADSLRQGVIAAAVGFLIVAIYMAFFYRGLGVLSWFSLTIFMCLFIGVLSGLGQLPQHLWSLTLPSVAAIVFSIGSAADSSILVFERFKEEVRAGKTVRTAVQAGFRHALGTVLDADIVAFITALFIYLFAIGPVKGFAFTLMLGLAIDLVTLTLFTRSVLILMSDTRALRSKMLVGVKAEA